MYLVGLSPAVVAIWGPRPPLQMTPWSMECGHLLRTSSGTWLRVWTGPEPSWVAFLGPLMPLSYPSCLQIVAAPISLFHLLSTCELTLILQGYLTSSGHTKFPIGHLHPKVQLSPLGSYSSAVRSLGKNKSMKISRRFHSPVLVGWCIFPKYIFS